MRYIYVIRNSHNEKVYVGQTYDLAQRKAAHLYTARKGDHRPLYQAIREIGAENFSFEAIEECVSDQLAAEREKFWVEQFNSFDGGYNSTSGGGYHVGNRGRKFSTETRRKMSESRKGWCPSEETRKKMSEAAKKRVGDLHPMYGKHHSEEALKKMSESKHHLYESSRGVEICEKISKTLSGRKQTEEHIRNAAAKRKGRKRSQTFIDKVKGRKRTLETRRKISEAAKRRGGGESHPNYGKKRSEETRRKISESLKKRAAEKLLKIQEAKDV